MKIAFLNRYQNKVSRGVETFVYELSKRLSKNNEVDVISDINYFNLFKKKYDVIIPTNGRFQSIIVRKISWFTGARVVISGQSGAGLDDRINLYIFPDIFVALSEYQKKWAEKINPFVKVVKIPNGVNLNDFRPGRKSNNTILSVGAFTNEKRHDLTIKAVARLSDVKLVIIGSGGDCKNDIESLGNQFLGKDRFEIKTVDHNKMPEEFNKASILAFPSVPWESFGIVLLEAMASGLPVVATDDPIRKEIIGDAGILVDPTNVEEYSQSLRNALETNWGNNPRKQAEQFSWDEISFQYEELFGKLKKF